MATAERETVVVNPARKGGKMTLKQRLHFGTKRQRAAAKASIRAKRSNPARAHRKRTKPKSSQKRSNPRHRRNTTRAKAKRRTNPGAIYALVNPATKGHKKVATHKRKHTSKRRHSVAGKQRNPGRVHHRRNPGMLGGPKEWLSLGGGAVVGGLGATSLPQMILGTSNTGAMGYVGTVAATGILAFLGNMAFKTNKALVMGIIAGGTGALIRRIIGDYSLAGQYTAQITGMQGMGDYLASDFLTPQTLSNGLQNAQLNKPSWGNIPAPAPAAVAVHGAGVGMGNLYGRPLY